MNILCLTTVGVSKNHGNITEFTLLCSKILEKYPGSINPDEIPWNATTHQGLH